MTMMAKTENYNRHFMTLKSQMSQKFKHFSSGSRGARGRGDRGPPGPVKISHKEDGRQKGGTKISRFSPGRWIRYCIL